MTVTVKNAVWSGRNYYGVICVYDDTANANVTIVIDNVTYTGPQMIYNRYGTTIVRDCTVSIEKNGASVSPQEFAEANRIILDGKTTINNTSTSTAVIWFPFANSAFTVSENSTVTITAPNTYMFYTDSAAKPIFNFAQNSDTRISTKGGLFYSAGTGAHIASSCTIAQNATLYAIATSNGSVPLFKCSGKFTIENDASLFLITLASSPVLYSSTTSEIAFTSPKNVVLYSNGGKVLSFATGSTSAPNTVNLAAKQINYWTKAKTPFESAGGFDDIPASTFSKSDGQNVNITQTLTSSAVISTTSNLTAQDTGYPISTATFDLTKAAVLSLGKLNVDVDRITDISSAVSGLTDADATVTYADSQQNESGKSAADGAFSMPITKKAVVGDTATIKSNKNFLISSVTAVVTGSVSITRLPDIPFNAFVAPRKTASIRRIDADWHLQLTDTRTNGGKWSLYVYLKSPLTNALEIVENAVVFTDDSTEILNETPIEIANGTSDKAGIIDITWTFDKGILLDIEAEKAYGKGNYSSTLEWGVDFE